MVVYVHIYVYTRLKRGLVSDSQSMRRGCVAVFACIWFCGECMVVYVRIYEYTRLSKVLVLGWIDNLICATWICCDDWLCLILQKNAW